MKNIFKILGVLSPVHIVLATLLAFRKKVGVDQFGNVYYEKKPIKGYKKTRRWVMYKGAAEASSVPPEWHGWLHHQTDVLPSQDGAVSYRREWQKPHEANQTGTEHAYRPPGHILSGGERDPATGDYEAWTPSK